MQCGRLNWPRVTVVLQSTERERSVLGVFIYPTTSYVCTTGLSCAAFCTARNTLGAIFATGRNCVATTGWAACEVQWVLSDTAPSGCSGAEMAISGMALAQVDSGLGEQGEQQGTAGPAAEGPVV